MLARLLLQGNAAELSAAPRDAASASAVQTLGDGGSCGRVRRGRDDQRLVRDRRSGGAVRDRGGCRAQPGGRIMEDDLLRSLPPACRQTEISRVEFRALRPMG